MFFPLSDDDRLLAKPAYVTWTLVALNGLLFLLQAEPDTVFKRHYARDPRTRRLW